METYATDDDGNLVIQPDAVLPPPDRKTREELQADLDMATTRRDESHCVFQEAVDLAQARLDAFDSLTE